MAEDMAKRVGQYVAIRDELKRIEEEHDKRRAPLLEIQERLTGIIRQFMDDNKLDNIKTEHGTAHTTTRYNASVQDGEAFMALVKEGNWDLIERRANSTACKDYVKKHNQLPAGVNLSAIQTLGVRRPGKAKED